MGSAWEAEEDRFRTARRDAAFGNESAAIKELQVAVALRPGDSNILYNAACVYALFQRKEEALEMLRKAMQTGYHNLDWIACDLTSLAFKTNRNSAASSKKSGPRTSLELFRPIVWPPSIKVGRNLV